MTHADALVELYGLQVRYLANAWREAQEYGWCEPESAERLERCQARKAALLAQATAAGLLEAHP